MTWRNATITSTIAAMKAAPRAIAAKPARRVAAASWRPTAWPTRTVAAIEMPNGTMNRIAAVCSAIWCAASAVVPIQPIRMAAVANSPYSSRKAPAIGAPTTINSASSVQSMRQKRPSTRYLRNGRCA